MTHALGPEGKLIVFHVQLIADLNTVNELATAFLDELGSEGQAIPDTSAGERPVIG